MPEVSEVAVVGVPHPRWVEAVVAIVVTRPGVEVSEDDVLRHASTRLASFKAPKRIVFADALPKNPSGKLLKRQLRDAYASLFRES
jgi:fatty-acyl-CoA synthase